MKKQCSSCGSLKSIEEFYQRKSKAGRVPTAQCKECVKARAAIYRSDPEVREKYRLYAKSRTSDARVRERQRRAEKQGRAYVSRTEMEKARANRLWLRSLASVQRAKKRVYKTPRRMEAERYRKRYRSDPIFNIRERLRAAARRRAAIYDPAKLIRSAIKRNGSSPRAEWVLQCSIQQLKDHLERHFSDGMSWDEFLSGNIHIDHITPLAKFDLSNPHELRQAWRLENLQPLWAADNIVKGCKVE